MGTWGQWGHQGHWGHPGDTLETAWGQRRDRVALGTRGDTGDTWGHRGYIEDTPGDTRDTLVMGTPWDTLRSPWGHIGTLLGSPWGHPGDIPVTGVQGGRGWWGQPRPGDSLGTVQGQGHPEVTKGTGSRWGHLGDIPREHRGDGDTLGTSWEQVGDKLGTLWGWRHFGDTMGTPRGPGGGDRDTLGTPRGDIGGMGRCWGHIGDTLGGCLGQCGDLVGMRTPWGQPGDNRGTPTGTP